MKGRLDDERLHSVAQEAYDVESEFVFKFSAIGLRLAGFSSIKGTPGADLSQNRHPQRVMEPE